MIGRRVVYKRPARIKIKSFQNHSKFIQTVSFSQYNRFNIYQSFTMQQNHLSLTVFNGPITVGYWIFTADGAESILKNKEFDQKAFGYQFLRPWLGEGKHLKF